MEKEELLWDLGGYLTELREEWKETKVWIPRRFFPHFTPPVRSEAPFFLSFLSAVFEGLRPSIGLAPFFLCRVKRRFLAVVLSAGA